MTTLISHEYQDVWSTGRKIILRFAFLFFIGFIFFMFLSGPLESLLAWVGKEILNSSGDLTVVSTGSGDRTMNWIALFIQTLIALFGTVIWSVFDRKRKSYNKFQYWFIVFLRIFVAFFMMSYGMAKVFKLQFPEASLVRLLQPLGEMSPMGLAWTYMGFSEGYNVFTGGLEVLAGLLLIPRRTQTLGGFLTVGVMTHVAMMNFFFDIPVKIFSVHLVLMGLYIFAADIHRFIAVFIKNIKTVSYDFYNPIKDKLYHKIIFWFKIIALTIYIGFSSWQGYTAERTIRDKRPKPALYGIWEVQNFTKNQVGAPPLITDSLRWRYLIRDRKGYVIVKTMTDDINRYHFTLDSTKTKVTLFQNEEITYPNFQLTQENDLMFLKGTLNGDTLDITLKAKDLTKIPLTSRGFHWVNEFPYNR